MGYAWIINNFLSGVHIQVADGRMWSSWREDVDKVINQESLGHWVRMGYDGREKNACGYVFVF